MPESALIQKILVVQPSWVGDAVMATPMLRSIRALYPQAEISYLLRRYVKPIYTGMPWADQLITYRTERASANPAKVRKSRFFDLAARLRTGHFDLAILLPNSFKSALVCKMAGIGRIVGYERDGRGFLLSDKLLPVKEKGKFIPTPIVKYYMGLARYLGGQDRDLSLELFVTDAERREADEVLARAGLNWANTPSPKIILNPGAQYGAAKCWLPEYFAQLADRLIEERGATILLSGSPRETKILDAIQSHMKHHAVDLCRAGQSLGSLKEIVRRCDLMVTNDTGPRHIAAALGVPVVTVFGPTFPEWTEINFEKERKVAIKVFCGPCQKKTCPLDHRCMTGLTPAMVFNEASALLANSLERGVPTSVGT